MIKVSKEQHNYILSILDDDLEIDFNDFLQDKQIEIGYDENYEPNDKWEKIQEIIDLIDNQSN